MKTWKVQLDIVENKKNIENEFYLSAVDFWEANKKVLEVIQTNKIKVKFARITEVYQ